jgi:hypothetical protein
MAETRRGFLAGLVAGGVGGFGLSRMLGGQDRPAAVPPPDASPAVEPAKKPEVTYASVSELGGNPSKILLEVSAWSRDIRLERSPQPRDAGEKTGAFRVESPSGPYFQIDIDPSAVTAEGFHSLLLRSSNFGSGIDVIHSWPVDDVLKMLNAAAIKNGGFPAPLSLFIHNGALDSRKESNVVKGFAAKSDQTPEVTVAFEKNDKKIGSAPPGSKEPFGIIHTATPQTTIVMRVK